VVPVEDPEPEEVAEDPADPAADVAPVEDPD